MVGEKKSQTEHVQSLFSDETSRRNMYLRLDSVRCFLGNCFEEKMMKFHSMRCLMALSLTTLLMPTLASAAEEETFVIAFRLATPNTK